MPWHVVTLGVLLATAAAATPCVRHLMPAAAAAALSVPLASVRRSQRVIASASVGQETTAALRIVAPKLSVWTALRAMWSTRSFAEFMSFLRKEAGDVILLDARPVLPATYLLMGKSANRYVLSDADPSLEQVLQQLINLLPVAARVPAEVDEGLQKRVASLFQSEKVVNQLLPSFQQRATELRERWLSVGNGDSLAVFLELSDYVLLSDLELLYGRRFTQTYSSRILPCFQAWVQDIARGASPGIFFTELGDILREHIAERRASPSAYKGDESVLQIYLEQGALERHALDGVVGLLSMTMMAAVFNTQVSLAWILVHLYSQPELLKIARDELSSCPNLVEYSHLVRLPFVNSCIDESVRLHTMLPGNTVVRRAKADVTYTDGERGQVSIPAGSMVWLYPNAVHLDEAFFPEPKAFCPMRMLNGNLERMSSEFELVTFGHGRQRCIGEKMVRWLLQSLCILKSFMFERLASARPSRCTGTGDDLRLLGHNLARH